MRWRPERVRAFLADNTRVFKDVFRAQPVRLGLRDLVRIHWRRGGWRDHLMMTLLAPLTLGLAAWFWMRFYGSCCFAGCLDPVSGRIGCLIHPARQGEPDLRRHAFPLVPVLGCNRALRCPMLDRPTIDPGLDGLSVSQAGFWSLRGK